MFKENGRFLLVLVGLTKMTAAGLLEQSECRLGHLSALCSCATPRSFAVICGAKTIRVRLKTGYTTLYWYVMGAKAEADGTMGFGGTKIIETHLDGRPMDTGHRTEHPIPD